MNETIVSDLKENSLACDLCNSRDTRHVREMKDGVSTDCWWRCLGCEKDYGVKYNFAVHPITKEPIIIKKILWKKDKPQEETQA